MKQLLLAMALCLTVAAENITFQWNANPESDVSGYLLHWSKNTAATNLTHYQQAGASWQGQWSVSGRLTTNITITIPGTNLVGTNVFRMTATSIAGLSSDLSNSLLATKPTKVTGEKIGTVEIQSTTNLMAWVTEDVVPFNMDSPPDDRKFWRAKLNVRQGNPALFLTVPTPPAP